MRLMKWISCKISKQLAKNDWYWFHFVILGDEFHSALNTDSEAILNGLVTLRADSYRVVRERQRAHDLDILWGNGKWNTFFKSCRVTKKLFIDWIKDLKNV